LEEIYREFDRRNYDHHSDDYEATIRQTIYDHSSDSESFRSGKDIFYKAAKGVWGLRDYR